MVATSRRNHGLPRSPSTGPAEIRVKAANSGSWRVLALPGQVGTTSEIDVSRNRTPRCDFRDDARQSVTGRLIDFRDHEQDHRSDGGHLPQQPRAGPGRLTSAPIPSLTAFPQLSTVKDRLVAAITSISAGPEQQGGELPPTHEAPRTSHEEVHLSPARPTVLIRLQRHLPTLPAPPSPPHRPGVPQ